MTREEIDKLHFPCLLQHKPSGLVVKMVSANGTSGTGTTKSRGTSENAVGKWKPTWNLSAFSMMDNNKLYEGKQ